MTRVIRPGRTGTGLSSPPATSAWRCTPRLRSAGTSTNPSLTPTARLDPVCRATPSCRSSPESRPIPGPLGTAFRFAGGMAMGLRAKDNPARVYVVMGDGELAEGSNWEAAAAASHHKLDNILVFVDRNGLQISGETTSVMSYEPLADRWAAFGWSVRQIDGHDFNQIVRNAQEIPFHAGQAVRRHRRYREVQGHLLRGRESGIPLLETEGRRAARAEKRARRGDLGAVRRLTEGSGDEGDERPARTVRRSPSCRGGKGRAHPCDFRGQLRADPA